MKKEFETLYARNSNGKINEWKIASDGTGNYSEVIITEGLLDGEKIITRRRSKGKNIGKMNETSDFDQACRDSESRWTLKKKKGYKSLTDLGILPSNTKDWVENELIIKSLEIVLPQNRTDANNLSKPMLAKPMFDSKTGKCIFKFPAIGQPKLNGFRIMCRWEKVMEGEGIFRQEVEKPVFRSRDGIKFDTLEHIEDDFTKDMFFHEGEELAYDGEIFNYDFLLQRINSAVNKKNSDTINLKFFVFDIAIENMIQTRRLELMNKLLSKFGNQSNPDVWQVQTEVIETIEQAEKQTDHWIRFKYEGGIFRDPKAFYQFGKRNYSMVKLKRFMDDEFEILDVIGGDNSPDLGVFVCKAKNGKSFKCTPQGTHDVKREYLANKVNYIGKLLTVKFYEYTAEGIPFHTTGLTIREFM